MLNLCRFFFQALSLSFCSSLLTAQEIHFPCDSNFQFYQILWSEPGTKAIYDSLNSIDFSDQDFELRIWEHTPGHLGMVHDAFILRHFKDPRGWRGYYYSGFKDGWTPKNMAEFFTDNELETYSREDWQEVWDTLVNYHILDLEPPSQEELEESYGFRVHTSHDTHFIIELIQEDCQRSYGFSYGTASTGPFDTIPEFVALRQIVKFRLKILQKGRGKTN